VVVGDGFALPRLGVVFQQPRLLDWVSVEKNVALALRSAGLDQGRAADMLGKVGLQEYLAAYPSVLSGGQRQRVAVARALVNNPSILLADEPTGNLDSATGNEIMALFERLFQQGNTIVLVTHEHDIALHAHRVIHIRDGKVEKDEKIK
jgi:putative ABC transport system ATP-binding protein